MKLKNLAFFGVMGAILSVAGANAAPYTGENAYLTTKGYVDSKVSSVSGNVSNIQETIATYGDVVTHNVAEFATAAQGGKADTALQPTSNLDGSKLTAGTVAKTALDSSVQTSLGLADSALQSADVGTMAGEDKDDYYTKTDADAAFATAAQGAKADSAVQTVETGTANGTIKVDGTAVSVYGLGTAAYTPSSDYATAAQGAKADTAVQSVVESTTNGKITVDNTDVAVHGLGTAAYTASSDYATAAQGALAATALQSANITASSANSLVQYGTDGLVTSGVAAGTLATVSPETSTCASGRTCLVTKNSDGTHQYTPITDSSDL